MVPGSRAVASGWEGQGRCSQCSFEERPSVREEILTGVIARHRRTSTCERSGRKDGKESAIYD
jgi:hypothetical protein